MKTRVFVIACIVLVLGFFLFSNENEKSKTVQLPEAPVPSEDQAFKTAITPDPVDSEANTEESSNEESQTPLQKLKNKVSKLSMFNQKALDELREEAYKAIEENPKEFESFTIEQVESADKNSVETMFFFVEAYAKKHPNPSEGVNEILKLEPKNKNEDVDHTEMGERQKQNMAKAFALEVFFDRLEKQPVSSTEGIGKVEGTVRGIIEKEADLMMVRQGLLVLKNYLGYESDQLKEIIDRRGGGENESSSYSDILKD